MTATTFPTRSRHLSLALAATLALLAAAPGAVQARERSTTATGANGHSVSRGVQRAGGDVSSSTRVDDKAVASRSVDRGAGSTTASVTGPRGMGASRDTTRSASGSSTTVTGPAGQTGSMSVTRQP